MEELHETNDTLANENDRLANQVVLSESHWTSLQTETVRVKQKLVSADATISLKDDSIRKLTETLKDLEVKNSQLLTQIKGKGVAVFKGKYLNGL
jgi:chromosome segregation ATPase